MSVSGATPSFQTSSACSWSGWAGAGRRANGGGGGRWWWPPPPRVMCVARQTPPRSAWLRVRELIVVLFRGCSGAARCVAVNGGRRTGLNRFEKGLQPVDTPTSTNSDQSPGKMSKMALKTDVLRVYRACLRSARKCPAWEQREMMKTYVRLKFRDQVQLKDETQIRRLLADAKEELEQMEYYHSVYAAKQREKEERDRQMASPMSAPSSEKENAFVNTLCRSCGIEYSPPQAKFCSNCGVKRT